LQIGSGNIGNQTQWPHFSNHLVITSSFMHTGRAWLTTQKPAPATKQSTLGYMLMNNALNLSHCLFG